MTHIINNKSSNPGLELDKPDSRIRELEDDLKEIQYKFKEAESIAQFGFWEVDPATLNPTWSEGLFKIIGLNPENGQLKYYDQKKFIHPEDWDDFFNVLQWVLETKKDAEMDVRVIRPDGSLRIVKVIAKPKTDENNEIIGVRGTAQDITDLKVIEFRLKESKAFYRTLFETTGTATIIVDDDSNILMANQQFEKLSGYSKEEIEGKKSWKDFALKSDREIMEKYHHLRRKNHENPPENYEARLRDKEGNIRIVLINVAIITGTKKTIASLTDLTELKNVEEVLQTTLKRFYTILSNMRASVLLVTNEDLIEFANQAFCDYFSLAETPDDLTGLTSSEMIEKIKNAYQYPPEEIHRIGEIVNNWEPVLGEEVLMQGERTCLRDFIPLFVGKKVYGRLWIHFDITQRKKMEKELALSEKRYRYMVEKATAGIFILDPEGKIKYLNDHMARDLKYNRTEMQEIHIKSFVDENLDFCRYRKPSELLIEQYNWFKFLDKQGNIFWSNLSVSPIFNSNKEFRGCLGIVTDITKQKSLEEAFLERENLFTDIIYDMMNLLNDIAKKENLDLEKKAAPKKYN